MAQLTNQVVEISPSPTDVEEFAMPPVKRKRVVSFDLSIMVNNYNSESEYNQLENEVESDSSNDSSYAADDSETGAESDSDLQSMGSDIEVSISDELTEEKYLYKVRDGTKWFENPFNYDGNIAINNIIDHKASVTDFSKDAKSIAGIQFIVLLNNF